MEFEDLQKVWDSQQNKMMYAINEDALFARILKHKRKAQNLAGMAELIIIFANLITFGLLASMEIMKGKGNVFGMVMAAVMLGTAVYMGWRRWKRIKEENRFDRSMLGELEHAIANADYTVRVARSMGLYLVAIAVLSLLSLVADGTNWRMVIGMAVFFVITAFASKWEYRWYVKRRDKLTRLRDKLEKEEELPV
ncbi:MAG: hypothetical protein AAFR61_06775 [Bacteroidota bacterium]